LAQLGDQNNVTDLQLGPLQDNGGPTQTHALLPGSPAIDAVVGACAVTQDQRGVSRPQDGDANGSAICDSGAFELAPSSSAGPSGPVTNEPETKKPDVDDDDKRTKETEEQRQQRQHTNAGHRGDVTTEGNVLTMEQTPDGKHLLVTIGVTKNETLVVQISCPGERCPDVRVGDYLEADGYQNGVGDPNTYFIAEDMTVLRNGKRVK